MNVNNFKFSVYNSVYFLLILSIIHIFVDNFIKNFDLLGFLHPIVENSIERW